MKGSDDILEVTRKAMTLVQADGYNPNTLAIDPAGAQSLDLLRTPGTEKMYIFTPGALAPGPAIAVRPRRQWAARATRYRLCLKAAARLSTDRGW